MLHWQKFTIYLILFITFGCSDDDTENSPSFSNELNATSFTVKVPDGWKLIIDQGIDTYVGRIVNGKDTIYFDQGYLSFGGLDRVEENDQTLSFEHTKINGVPSIIVKERTPEETGRNIRISAYIDKGNKSNLNRLYCFDPSDEASILNIMKSHMFLE